MADVVTKMYALATNCTFCHLSHLLILDNNGFRPAALYIITEYKGDCNIFFYSFFAAVDFDMRGNYTR